ncbi:beta-propeller fold lactonase family protein [Streptomyces sp. NPDC008121]|uniref:YVTN family beta-propeller repeat protein n=1 Tax=Streptomyces sp. NPDC008121 TaxID=3364809 RepID=UPI0036E22A43
MRSSLRIPAVFLSSEGRRRAALALTGTALIASLSVTGAAAATAEDDPGRVKSQQAAAPQTAGTGGKSGLVSSEISLPGRAVTSTADPILVGDYPDSVGLTPDGRYAYVTNALGGTVSVIDTAAQKTVGDPIKVGGMPVWVVVDAAHKRAYVSNNADNTVSVIDTETRRVVGEPLRVGKSPMGLEIVQSPVHSALYVANMDDNTVSVIDTGKLEVTGQPVPVGKAPMALAAAPDLSAVYVSNSADSSVSVIDTRTQTAAPEALPAGSSPAGMDVTSDGRRLAVANSGDDTVTLIDVASGEETDRIPTGPQPFDVALAHDDSSLYATNSAGNTVTAADLTDPARPTSAVSVGSFPYGIALTPQGSLYVANAGSDSVSHIAGASPQAGPSRTPIAMTLQGDGLNVHRETSGFYDLVRLSAAEPSVSFDYIDCQDGTFALKARDSGKYLSFYEQLSRHLTINRDALGPWEKFTYTSAGGTMQIRSAHTGEPVQYAPQSQDQKNYLFLNGGGIWKTAEFTAAAAAN